MSPSLKRFWFACIVGSQLYAVLEWGVQAQYCVQWVRRDEVGSPGARAGHAMAYDSDRHVTVLFGGDVPGSDPSTWFNAPWEYDGVQWTQVTIDGPVPDRRSNHAMCYDPIHKQVVMTGGENEGGYLSDTWLFTSTGPGRGTWTPGPNLHQRRAHPEQPGSH